MQQRSCDAPKLDTIYVSFDGSLKAVYQDNTVLVLSADSSSFTHVSPAGARTTQLCEFCLSRFAPLLTELLDFRNQHVDVPAVCRPFLQQLERSQQLFTLHYPITYLCWPSTAAEAFQQNLVELPDNTRVAVFSRCSYARIVMEYAGLRFAVRYPLLVAYHPATNSYTYTWQTQVFSRSQYPERWQAALAVATSVADNAAHGFPLRQQHSQQQQQQHLADITNLLHQQQQQAGSSSALIRCSNACSSSPVQYGSPSRAAAAALPPGSSSPKRYGSPLQQQHRGWQQQGRQSPTVSSPAAAAAVRASDAWSHCSSPTRMSQQQQQQLFLHGLRPQSAAVAESSSTCITQLPIDSDLLATLPLSLRSMQAQRPVQQQQHTPPQQPDALAPAGSSNNSRIAAALAQALGHRQGLCMAAAAAAGGGGDGLDRGWWLEPSLLLPSDELLHMVWTQEATMLFVQDTGEVEVWLHADDSCMYSFQSGAFITHLMPRAAAAGWDSTTPAAAAAAASADMGSPPTALQQGTSAAASWHEAPAAAGSEQGAASITQVGIQLKRLRVPPAAAAAAAAAAGVASGNSAEGHAAGDAAASLGLVDGRIDASEMSRVYAASALPEVPVPAAAAAMRTGDSSVADRAGLAAKAPVGQVAARALKFRGTMVRVRRLLLSSSKPYALHLAATTSASQADRCCNQQLAAARNTLPSSQQQQQQQVQFSAEVLEEQQVPGVGRFIATRDGRVRVLFEDRTILNLSADGGAVSLLLPDGSRRQVAAANPVGVAHYVQAAQEFAAWAQTTPAERAAALRMQALVAAEVRSSARMAAICEWGAGQRLPAAAAAAAAVGAAQQEIATAAAEAELEATSRGAHQHTLCGSILEDESKFGCGAAAVGGIKSGLGGAAGGDAAQARAADAVARQQAVEGVLQANARLLQRLKS